MHGCPVPNCETQFANREWFMCRNHWAYVPKALKQRLRAGGDVLDQAIDLARERDQGYHGRNFDPTMAGARR